MGIEKTIVMIEIKRNQGMTDEAIYESMIGRHPHLCPDCRTYDAVEINGSYECLKCHPEYLELFDHR